MLLFVKFVPDCRLSGFWCSELVWFSGTSTFYSSVTFFQASALFTSWIYDFFFPLQALCKIPQIIWRGTAWQTRKNKGQGCLEMRPPLSYRIKSEVDGVPAGRMLNTVCCCPRTQPGEPWPPELTVSYPSHHSDSLKRGWTFKCSPVLCNVPIWRMMGVRAQTVLEDEEEEEVSLITFHIWKRMITSEVLVICRSEDIYESVKLYLFFKVNTCSTSTLQFISMAGFYL